ncbi:MAG TPA: hydroxymethylglutaryl-CoA lyase [Casimicrobiaceae bacterium]|nr:hydroxymethylglutaryl-CoA lyase [Casimicrobiaceae bacterium]
MTNPTQGERPRVRVTEVGTRDGFQAEPRFIATATKARIVDALIDAGVRHLEATSFVSPRAVPQLADAHELLSLITRRRDASLAALVPNARGAERALGAGVDEIVCFVSASESHNSANLNASIDESLANVAAVASIVAGKVPLRGAVSCAFGCPFEGEVPVEAALRVIEGYVNAGVRHLTLGDTTGMATPPTVTRLVEASNQRFPALPIALHFHNTRGVGLANVVVGLELGIREFESSIAGLGGCPFAPGATGNVCTEDLVYLLEESGYDTGIDLDRLIGVAHIVEEVVGRTLPGQVMKAGPRLRKFGAEDARCAVG